MTKIEKSQTDTTPKLPVHLTLHILRQCLGQDHPSYWEGAIHGFMAENHGLISYTHGHFQLVNIFKL